MLVCWFTSRNASAENYLGLDLGLQPLNKGAKEFFKHQSSAVFSLAS